MMKNYESELAGKRIFITGHTGFTGSWATIWLHSIGVNVFGYSLAPETNPNLFSEAKVAGLVAGVEADIRDFEKLQEAMAASKPDLVLHLAAQPLVRRSYRIPRETFDINTQGTANVLEAARATPSVKGVLCITTDKVYKNLEVDYKYKETDDLGGKDPYSASKAAAELVISSFRDSFDGEGSPLIAVARGGNIIGGGDWSEDRLIPDFVRSHMFEQSMTVRNINSTRPWQHVLALVEGYFTILAGLLGEDSERYARAFNLGPLEEDSVSVGAVISELGRQIAGVKIEVASSNLTEAGKLGLDSSLAMKTFGWNPTWSTIDVIRKTADWYKAHLSGEKSAYELCIEQIDSWKAL
jgi:CDP-glucose 4,6-dehydratase